MVQTTSAHCCEIYERLRSLSKGKKKNKKRRNRYAGPPMLLMIGRARQKVFVFLHALNITVVGVVRLHRNQIRHFRLYAIFHPNP